MTWDITKLIINFKFFLNLWIFFSSYFPRERFQFSPGTEIPASLKLPWNWYSNSGINLHILPTWKQSRTASGWLRGWWGGRCSQRRRWSLFDLASFTILLSAEYKHRKLTNLTSALINNTFFSVFFTPSIGY